MRFLVLLLAILAAFAAHAQDRQPLAIAIMPIRGSSLTEAERANLTDRLTQHVVSLGEYLVVEREFLHAVTGEQQLGLSACGEVRCAVEAGHLLGASKVLIGRVSRLPGLTTVMLRLIDVERGTIDGMETWDVAGPLSRAMSDGLGNPVRSVLGIHANVETTPQRAKPTEWYALWERADSIRSARHEGHSHLRDLMQIYDDLLSIDDQQSTVWLHRAVTLFTMVGAIGWVATPLDNVDRAIELEPTAAAYDIKATILVQIGRYEQALAAYDMAIRLDPTDVEAAVGRGAMLGMLGLWTAALSATEQVLQEHPEIKEAWVNRGMMLIELGRFDEALVALERGLELDPTDEQALANRGIALKRLGRYEEALDCFTWAHDQGLDGMQRYIDETRALMRKRR